MLSFHDTPIARFQRVNRYGVLNLDVLRRERERGPADLPLTGRETLGVTLKLERPNHAAPHYLKIDIAELRQLAAILVAEADAVDAERAAIARSRARTASGPSDATDASIAPPRAPSHHQEIHQ